MVHEAWRSNLLPARVLCDSMQPSNRMPCASASLHPNFNRSQPSHVVVLTRSDTTGELPLPLRPPAHGSCAQRANERAWLVCKLACLRPNCLQARRTRELLGLASCTNCGCPKSHQPYLRVEGAGGHRHADVPRIAAARLLQRAGTRFQQGRKP